MLMSFRRSPEQSPIPGQGSTPEPSRSLEVGEEGLRPELPASLLEFADRVAYVVTDLNGLISSVVNEELDSSDFDHDLTKLFDKLTEVERTVSELGDLFWG